MKWSLKNSYLELPDYCFTKANPTPVKSPKIVLLNLSLAKTLGLDLENSTDIQLTNLFSGNSTLEQSTPVALAYSGHQFGQFTMLGDGRAHMLGEHTSPNNQFYDIQLKGSGKTPYSRGGDGRAALGPMLREYIISEAMHALRIPTTRSLAVVTTGESVLREKRLNGAILTRIASSHLRVGTFQFVATKGTKEELKQLMNYTINRHYPEIKQSKEAALELVKVVMQRQIELIVHWLRVGFIHGVMNTDNMAISGETIDYGPCAFMDSYDPLTVFSSIDHTGRYAFANQPSIAIWNIARFAECLIPLVDANSDTALDKMNSLVQEFNKEFPKAWLNMMRNKLGLGREEPEDEQLVHALLQCMQRHKMDYTQTFRALISETIPNIEAFQQEELKDWWNQWQQRLAKENTTLQESQNMMKANNPVIIPRNHKVEEALEAAETHLDFSKVNRLLAATTEPYSDKPEFEEYKEAPESGERVYQTFCGT